MNPTATDRIAARDLLALFSIIDFVSYGHSFPTDEAEPECEIQLSEQGLGQALSVRSKLGGRPSYHCVFSSASARARQMVGIVSGQTAQELEALGNPRAGGQDIRARAESALAEIVEASKKEAGGTGLAILVSGPAAAVQAIIGAIGSVLDDAGHSAGKFLQAKMIETVGEAELVRLMVVGASVELRIFKPDTGIS